MPDVIGSFGGGMGAFGPEGFEKSPPPVDAPTAPPPPPEEQPSSSQLKTPQEAAQPQVSSTSAPASSSAEAAPLSQQPAAPEKKTPGLSDRVAKAYADLLNDFGPKITAIEEQGLVNEDTKEQWTKTRADRARLLLMALGASREDVDQQLEHFQDDPDSFERNILFNIARSSHTTLDHSSEAIRALDQALVEEFERVLRGQMNRAVDRSLQVSPDDMRAMATNDVLRRVMSIRVVPDDEQADLIAKLFDTDEAKALGIEPTDSIEVVLKAIITGEKKKPAEKKQKKVIEIEELIKRDRESADPSKTPQEFTERNRQELFDLVGEHAATTGAWLAGVWENNVDLGAFMSMLLTGAEHGAMLHDLGYKSKESLRREGIEAVDADDLHMHIVRTENKVGNARELLLVGMEDVLPADKFENYKHMKAEDLMRDKPFRAVLVDAVRAHSNEVAANILYSLGKIRDKHAYLNAHERGEKLDVALTLEAMEYYLLLPELAEKGEWKEVAVGEKKQETGAVDEVKAEAKAEPVQSPTAEPAAHEEKPGGA